MARKTEKNPRKFRIGRRAFLLTGVQLIGVGALGARAKFLQIDQNEHYVKLAEDNRIDVELEPAARGKIFDSEGVLVADNRNDFRVDVECLSVPDAQIVIDNLSHAVPLSEKRKSELVASIESAKKRRENLIINVASHLTWEQYSLINENLPVLPGVTPKIAYSRYYPYNDLLAHQVGYVGKVSERDLASMPSVPPIYYTPSMAIGKTGIEAKFETELRGKEATKRREKNVYGQIVRALDESTNSIPGSELRLTLDAKMHHYAMERLKGESGAVVVMDVENGDVKLLASTPSFDANLFVLGISQTDYDELLNNKLFPLNHKAVHGVYPPGSTFKMVTALAALEQGISPNASYNCTGKINRGRDFYCWKSSGHGPVSLRNALKYSCDVYFYSVAERTSIDNISKMAHKLGLGERFEIPQSAVAQGLVPTREWKQENRGEDWVVGDTLNAGIGQGFVLATPLQLAVMTARIATGKEVKPNLISSVSGRPYTREVPPDLDIDPEHLKWVRQGMYAVSNESRGTGLKTRINADGQKWAGKTGTAQVVAISKAEREAGVVKNEDRVRERRDHALFVAFAPYDKPKYAVAVVVEHGGGGSTSAAPVARDMMLYALYNDVPPLRAYPTGRGAAARFWNSVPPLETKMTQPDDGQPAEGSEGTEETADTDDQVSA